MKPGPVQLLADGDLIALVNSLVGQPYEEGARGPHAWSCWGLAWHVLRAGFGIDLPFAPLDQLMPHLAASEVRRRFAASAQPVHGAIAAMTRAETPHHVGVYLAFDGGVVLHALEGSGVIVSPLAELVQLRFQTRWYAPVTPEPGRDALRAA
jgi:cell wall-associated NlpC family hydrolase